MRTDQEASTSNVNGPWKRCTVIQVEETKIVVRMLPIILSTVFMNTCLAQLQTFTIQQSTTMDRKIHKFEVPGASIPAIPLLFMIILIPIYERVFVPNSKEIHRDSNRKFAEISRLKQINFQTREELEELFVYAVAGIDTMAFISNGVSLVTYFYGSFDTPTFDHAAVAGIDTMAFISNGVSLMTSMAVAGIDTMAFISNGVSLMTSMAVAGIDTMAFISNGVSLMTSMDTSPDSRLVFFWQHSSLGICTSSSSSTFQPTETPCKDVPLSQNNQYQSADRGQLAILYGGVYLMALGTVESKQLYHL
ncbi:hypothetical protein K7X08_001874 [Anisodus acutangulus]|uniref:Uncharacterized protein n=1 Tax=Anisodus acutangulus TaxID=402998 RepID=A0A9Q1LSC8_9SOLA|nr:hypothetical protein K7X08_001874 [Anisodus acutangulus]